MPIKRVVINASPLIILFRGHLEGLLPDLSIIEQISDPKEILFKILREASGLKGRRLKKFNMAESRIRITELVSGFAPLRKLNAFQRLEEDISILKRNDWILEI
jgi:hypothetical protein